MLLVAATVLSVISMITTFLSSIAGVIIVGVSISLYAVGAVYLYQISKFSEMEEYDIEKYQTFLTKVFSYVKTNFIFWSISLSLIIAKFIHAILVSVINIATINNAGIQTFIKINGYLVLIFIIVWIIIGVLFI